ncbi:unnamed protein product [Adineta ricciae]|uniref:Uncharacterized protein n=1 Tax=Adineta ricciae TaxID=249248 RepID=A0A815E5B9_ADIRI|nr:unnamed protein product [Adineta ricciae]
MKLYCLFILFLFVNIPKISAYPDNRINSLVNIEEDSFESPSSSFMEEDHSIVKRSQRNANFLYRYCRHAGGGQRFCLKYAIQMLYATGH